MIYLLSQGELKELVVEFGVVTGSFSIFMYIAYKYEAYALIGAACSFFPLLALRQAIDGGGFIGFCLRQPHFVPIFVAVLAGPWWAVASGCICLLCYTVLWVLHSSGFAFRVLLLPDMRVWASLIAFISVQTLYNIWYLSFVYSVISCG